MSIIFLFETDLTLSADIGVLISSSPQTTPSKWSSILDDVNSMVDAFAMSQRGAHFAVSTVGTVIRRVLSFNTPTESTNNLKEVKRRISKVPYEKVESTRLDLGLKEAADDMFTEENGLREESSKVFYSHPVSDTIVSLISLIRSLSHALMTGIF